MIGRELFFDPTARRILFAASLPVVLISIGCVGYHRIEGWSWFDALYMTVITIATVGFGETHELSQTGRTFTIALILGGAFTMAAAVTSVIRSIVSGEVQRLLGRQRTERILNNLANHVIVCGYGRMGRSSATSWRRRTRASSSSTATTSSSSITPRASGWRSRATLPPTTCSRRPASSARARW